jgi:hypothetical protein
MIWLALLALFISIIINVFQYHRNFELQEDLEWSRAGVDK